MVLATSTKDDDHRPNYPLYFVPYMYIYSHKPCVPKGVAQYTGAYRYLPPTWAGFPPKGSQKSILP